MIVPMSSELLPPFRVIAAIDGAGGIGWCGQLPFSVRPDIAYFRRKIEHSVVIGTRATLDQIGKPPPGARLWGVSRRGEVRGKHWEMVWPDWRTAVIEATAQSPWPWVVGGEWLFSQCLPHASELYLTRVHGTFPADRFFPENWAQLFPHVRWSESHPESVPAWIWELRSPVSGRGGGL